MAVFWSTWAAALPWLLAAAFATWLFSVVKRNVTIVDTLWSLLFLLAAWRYASSNPGVSPREKMLLVMVALWSARLALYLAWRNSGHPEDARYAALRRRNDPGFAWKSLYLVFGMQALLAWIISLPLAGAMLFAVTFSSVFHSLPQPPCNANWACSPNLMRTQRHRQRPPVNGFSRLTGELPLASCLMSGIPLEPGSFRSA